MRAGRLSGVSIPGCCHAVHHSPTQVDWLVNALGHPADFVFTRRCGLLSLYSLGLGDPVAGDADPERAGAMALRPIPI